MRCVCVRAVVVAFACWHDFGNMCFDSWGVVGGNVAIRESILLSLLVRERILDLSPGFYPSRDCSFRLLPWRVQMSCLL